MPWCATCDRFLSPSTVRTDGTCPTCGQTIDGEAPSSHEGEPALPLPWHVKLLAAAVALYLGFRTWPAIDWLIDRL